MGSSSAFGSCDDAEPNTRRARTSVTERSSALSIGVVGFVVLAAHLALYPKIADLDGFYHLGHAAAYATGSPFDTSLPWATQSVIMDKGADLWWGFHVLLMPFARMGNVEWGVRGAALLMTSVLAACFYGALRRHGVTAASWWTVVFLGAVPNVLFRYVMVRPHVLSLGGALLLLSVLARGRWMQVFVLSSFMSWLHLALFWMAPGVVAAYAFVRGVETAVGVRREGSRGVPPLWAIGAVLAGTVAGWLLRPHPLGAASLAGVQIIRLFAEKATEEPLLFAAELFPLSPLDLLRSAWLFLPIWLVTIAVTVRATLRERWSGVEREQRTLLLTALLISGTFLVLTLFSARRALVEWVAFGSVALPFAWRLRGSAARSRLVRIALASVVAAHVGWAAWRHVLNVDVVAFPPDTMAGPAAFLADNGAANEVVFHARWDNFGPLFARNRGSRYLGGMDPIFQFAHDPRSYWEFFYLSADLTTEWTCDAFPCATGAAMDTPTVMREHFGARWVVVEPLRNPRFALYLLGDPGFRLAYEGQREVVFEVLAPGEVGGE